jgi:hypothetical protein
MAGKLLATDLRGFPRISSLSFHSLRGICWHGQRIWERRDLYTKITSVTFDRRTIEARLSLNLIASSDMPKVAWDALEAGLDGPGIRRLAALDSPTYFEVRDVLPRAMKEMGLVKLTPNDAALRLAKNRAKEILDRGEDPLKHTREFERLWIHAGYRTNWPRSAIWMTI